MLGNILAALAAAIVTVISAAGYVGIAALMALESACIPLPSEVIMPFAGYLVSTGRFSLVGVATAGALGCNIGSTVAYLVAARGGRRLVERWGSVFLISRSELDWVETFFARHGAVTVFVGRLLPVVRTFIAGRPRPDAADQVPGLHLRRLMALVLRAGLHRGEAGRALGQRPDASGSVP